MLDQKSFLVSLRYDPFPALEGQFVFVGGERIGTVSKETSVDKEGVVSLCVSRPNKELLVFQILYHRFQLHNICGRVRISFEDEGKTYLMSREATW